jgi:hypothetical protein
MQPSRSRAIHFYSVQKMSWIGQMLGRNAAKKVLYEDKYKMQEIKINKINKVIKNSGDKNNCEYILV